MKSKMNRWGVLLAFCALPLAAAETAEQRGKRVVDEALQALGGDAFKQMQNRLETGRAYSFYRSELSGLSQSRLYTRYLPKTAATQPGQLLVEERQSFGKPKEEISALVFNREGAWEITYRGARPLPDQRVENYRDNTRRNIFYILRERLDEPGMTFYSKGSDIYENRPVEIVDITDADNVTVTVYFGKSDKLPVRQVFRRRNPEFKDFDEEVTVFSKYRDAGGGVTWPFAIRRERNGEKIYEMFADTVEINTTMTDDLFTLSPSMKILPKMRD
jgi:hypothetical protein